MHKGSGLHETLTSWASPTHPETCQGPSKSTPLCAGYSCFSLISARGLRGELIIFAPFISHNLFPLCLSTGRKPASNSRMQKLCFLERKVYVTMPVCQSLAIQHLPLLLLSSAQHPTCTSNGISLNSKLITGGVWYGSPLHNHPQARSQIC